MKRVITRSIVMMYADLGISVIAEGIECLKEAIALQEIAFRLFQDYLSAKPAVEPLPGVPQELIATVEQQLETALLLKSGTWI